MKSTPSTNVNYQWPTQYKDDYLNIHNQWVLWISLHVLILWQSLLLSFFLLTGIPIISCTLCIHAFPMCVLLLQYRQPKIKGSSHIWSKQSIWTDTVDKTVLHMPVKGGGKYFFFTVEVMCVFAYTFVHAYWFYHLGQYMRSLINLHHDARLSDRVWFLAYSDHQAITTLNSPYSNNLFPPPPPPGSLHRFHTWLPHNITRSSHTQLNKWHL